MTLIQFHAGFLILIATAAWAGSQPFPSNGTVFASSLQVPSLAARTPFPLPRDEMDPLTAARVSHWRCRYEKGRLVEVARRDRNGSLRPMRPMRFSPPKHGVRFHYASVTATLPCRITTPNDVDYALFYDDAGLLAGIVCSNSRLQRGAPYSQVRIKRGDHGNVTSVSYWHEDRPSTDNLAVHAKSFLYGPRGFLSEVRYLNPHGDLRRSLLGIARKTYKRGKRGEWLGVSFWASEHTRTTDWHGVARYALAYTQQGKVEETSTFDVDDAAFINALGAHRVRWQYNHRNELIGIRAFAPDGTLAFDGPAPAPELFDRTWPEAVIAAERAELALPFWSFMDYSALARAWQRWDRRTGTGDPPVPFRIEQLRVLADYLIYSRATVPALAACYQCRAAGLADARRLQAAILASGVAPHPESDAAAFLVREFLGFMPSNAMYFGGSDPGRFLPEYAVMAKAVRPDIVCLTHRGLADSTYLASVRRVHTNVWLPSLADIQSAVQRYAQLLEARDPAVLGDEPMDIGPGHVAVRDRHGVMWINTFLLRMICDRNGEDRQIFLEERQANPSLCSFLQPTGPIFRLHADSAPPITTNSVENVIKYWRSLRTALADRPDDPEWQVARHVFARCAAAQATLLSFDGCSNAAADVYEIAIDICPDEPRPYIRLTVQLLEQDRCAEAERIIDRLCERLPAHREANRLRGKCRRAAARLDRIRNLESALHSTPRPCESNMTELLTLYDMQGKASNARKIAELLMRSCTNSVETLEHLVAFHARHDNFQEIETCLSHLTRLNPDSFDHWVSRAAIAYERNEPEEAGTFLRRAAELDRARLRRLLERRGFLDELMNQGSTNLVRELQGIVEDAGNCE